MRAAANRVDDPAARRPAWCVFGAIPVAAAVFLFDARLLEPAPIYHDNAAIAYPTRVLVSTALQHGIFPLWDHWAHAGAPLCTLVVALPLSPIVLGLSAFGIYAQTTFLVELVVVDMLALVGMYFWLRTVADEGAALIGAVCYALSAILLIQAAINIEAVTTQAMIPWYALGLRRSLRGSRRGAGLLAGSLWIMFTTGYLGLDLFVVEIVTPYVLADDLLRGTGDGPPAQRWRGLGHVAVGVVLFLGIMNLAFLETYRQFGVDVTQVRQTPFDPFTGSARPDAVYTLLWPNLMSPFIVYPGGAHVFPLYAGSVTVFLVAAALRTLRTPWEPEARRVALLLAVAAAAFLATMSARHGGALFTEILPLYSRVRFHCWGLAVVVFFATTLGALGMRDLRERGGAGAPTLATVGLAAVGLLVLQRGAGELAAIRSYPQCYTLPLIAVLLSRSLRWRWPTRTILVIVLVLMEIGAVSRQIPSLRDGTSPAAVAARTSAALLALNEKVKTPDFPAPSNLRTPSAAGNVQYFTKVPTYAGYNPNIHPIIHRLQRDPRFAQLTSHLLYAAEADGLPAREPLEDVRLEQLTPNVIQARLTARSSPTLVTYASPFVPAWHLRVDGIPRETIASRFGLTTFSVEEGPHDVELRYRPPALWASAALSLISLATVLVIAVRREPPSCGVRTEER
jgi:hypothetical protein